MKELYSENYKTLIKDLKMIQRNENISCFLDLEELTLLKCPQHSKQSLSNYRFNAIPIKIPKTFFTKLEQLVQFQKTKIHVKPQNPPNCQSDRETKNKAGGITLPGFDTTKLQ